MKALKTIETGVSNYYGAVKFIEGEDGKFYIELENYSGFSRVEISKKFFECAKKEFNK
ncbi:hypothetical protein [Acinetobacter phage vB_AbaM_fThrA]|uniref:Uncharacterized protein n=2 Tax=unclassified bacterial viruses TaxID=12333 RepID=A0AAU8KZ41_9VIRU|nr:hypothetical protein [Acinetobacter phage vB_AbaM_fThrA]